MSTHGPHSFVTTVQAEWPVPFNTRAASFPLKSTTEKSVQETMRGGGGGGVCSQPPPPNTVENPYEYRVCVHRRIAKHSKPREPRSSCTHSRVLNARKASTFILQRVSVANIHHESDLLVIMSWGHKGQSKLLNWKCQDCTQREQKYIWGQNLWSKHFSLCLVQAKC